MPRLPVAVICLLLICCNSTRGENWPGWRGPRGDGRSLETQVPTVWDGQQRTNVRWKTPIPGAGHSSPIVWQNQLFLTTCLPEEQARQLLSIDCDSGEIRWRRTVLTAKLESKHILNSYASSTPATDGHAVFVTFLEPSEDQVPAPNVSALRMIHPGRIVVAAYDFDGNQLWITRPSGFLSAHGFCSNPVLYQRLVIINGDHDGDSYLFALDKSTGEVVWRTPRRHKTRSYGTPLIRHLGGRMQLLLAGSKCVAGFNPMNGSRYWHVEGPTEQFVASIVDNGSFCFVVGGYPTHHVMAIDPGGNGDVTASHVVWHVENARCYVPSPVVVGDYLVVADDRGTANCFDARSGDRLWQTRMGKHYSASLVTAGGLVYFLADDGITKVLRPGPDVDVVSTNPLGEQAYASPAIAENRMFIRGEKHLFCIASD